MSRLLLAAVFSFLPSPDAGVVYACDAYARETVEAACPAGYAPPCWGMSDFAAVACDVGLDEFGWWAVTDCDAQLCAICVRACWPAGACSDCQAAVEFDPYTRGGVGGVGAGPASAGAAPHWCGP